MDRLDAALLREVLRDRALLWGGGDARLRLAELAARVGVDRTTVWARLRRWKREGFLVRHEAVPNPSVLGFGLAAGDIRVDDPRRKPEVLASLSLVPGVLGGGDQVGPYILLLYAHETPAALERCRRLVGQLRGVDEVSLCVPFAPPRSAVEPSPTDWRILQALREHPEGPLRRVAQAAGASTRTLTRRYRELLEANAIWWFPVLDWTRYRDATMARFVVTLAHHRDQAGVVNACRRGLRELVWWNAPPDPPPGAAASPWWVDVYAHLRSAAEVQDLQGRLLDLRGVQGVEVFFPRSWFVLPAWFDERIAAQAARTAQAGAGRPGPRRAGRAARGTR